MCDWWVLCMFHCLLLFIYWDLLLKVVAIIFTLSVDKKCTSLLAIISKCFHDGLMRFRGWGVVNEYLCFLQKILSLYEQILLGTVLLTFIVKIILDLPYYQLFTWDFPPVKLVCFHAYSPGLFLYIHALALLNYFFSSFFFSFNSIISSVCF